MIQINSLKLPCGHSKEELEEKICKQLKISRSHLKSWKILRQSIDARAFLCLSYRGRGGQ